MPPPAPPQAPQPPHAPYIDEWQEKFTILQPPGSVCLVGNPAYTQADYLDLNSHTTHSDCANLCLRTAGCTAFESPSTRDYCFLWLNGACNSTASPGFIKWSPRVAITYELRGLQPAGPTADWGLILGIAIPVGVLAMLFMVVFCRSYALRRRRQRDKLLLLSKGTESEHVVEMSERGVRIEDRIRQVITALAVGQSPNADASARASEKFASDPQRIIVGEQQDAVLGIGHFMRVTDDVIHIGLTLGVSAIVDEFERGATDEARECLHYVLHEHAGSSKLTFPNSPFPRDWDANGVRSDRLRSGEGMTLDDFVAHPYSRKANLSRAHVLALRLYTTAAYKEINQPLRDLAAGDHNEPHPLPVTVALLQEAMGKLRAVNTDEAGELAVLVGSPSPNSSRRQELWRGLKNLSIGDEDPFVLRGGTELAPLSTTTSIEVALGYSTSTSPVLMRLCVSTFMQTGADVTYLSAFPAEEERVYPPLTYLEPRGSPLRIPIDVGGRTTMYTILTVVPHIGK